MIKITSSMLAIGIMLAGGNALADDMAKDEMKK